MFVLGRVAIASLLGCIISCTQNPPAAKGRGSMTSSEYAYDKTVHV